MILLITLFLLSLAFGQEAIKLTPQKAYELALKNNAELKKLRYQIESTNFQIQEAKNYFLPYISLGAGVVYNSETREWEKPFGIRWVK